MLKRLLPLALLALAVSQAHAADAPSITFLTADAARKEIINDAMEPYFSRLQTVEMEMKTGKPLPDETLDAQRAECRKRYQAAIADFSDDEKKLITAAIEKAHARTADYPLYHNLPWIILNTDGTIEGGMPYTRGGSIILSDRTLQRDLRAGQANGALLLARVLLHEQSHVLQRKYPKIMADLYENLWHWEKIDPPTLDPSLVATHIFNPDGTDVTWAYPIGDAADHTYILPMIIAEKPPGGVPWVMLRDMRMVAIPLTLKDKKMIPETVNGKTKVTDLNTYRDYIKTFPVDGNNYHPNEIAAEAFAIIAWAQENVPERWKPERDWFKTHLQLPK